MKKGPNLRWSLIQCSGGDEGDRTPDLLTASQALSQLSYAPVRRSTIRELPRRCKDIFGKTFAGAAPVRPIECEAPEKPAGRAPRAGAAAARLSGALMRPRDPPPAAFRFLGATRPAPQRLFRRRRSHYWARSRSDPTGHFKTMPDYGARPGTPEHAGISGTKTAGRRFVHSVKCRVWTDGLGSAP